MTAVTGDQIATNTAAWESYAAGAAITDPSGRTALPRRMEWTQIPGLGPGEEILGALNSRTVLELGCGTGDNAAYLSTAAAHVIALDAAPAQISRALNRWPNLPHLEFISAEATGYLTRPHGPVDVVVSVFGALDFAPPDRLLPLIVAKLRPGGLLAFSTLHPSRHPRIRTDRLHLPNGTSAPISRTIMDPNWWPTALTGQGLTTRIHKEVTAADDTEPSCLIVTATKTSSPDLQKQRP